MTATATPDDAVDAGKVFLIDDGRVRKLSRAVTSKTTLSATEPEALKKIKMTAAIDLIPVLRHDGRRGRIPRQVREQLRQPSASC